jgi:hypothetical protein
VFERQEVVRASSFLGLPVGKKSALTEVMRCRQCGAVVEAGSGEEPDGDGVEHLATRLGVIAVLQAGDPGSPPARSAAVLAVRETTNLAYDQAALDLDLTMAPATRLAEFLRPAAGFPSVVRERILARLISTATAGGLQADQRHVLALVAHHLGLDVETCRAVVARCQAAAPAVFAAPAAPPAAPPTVFDARPPAPPVEALPAVRTAGEPVTGTVPAVWEVPGDAAFSGAAAAWAEPPTAVPAPAPVPSLPAPAPIVPAPIVSAPIVPAPAPAPAPAPPAPPSPWDVAPSTSSEALSSVWGGMDAIVPSPAASVPPPPVERVSLSAQVALPRFIDDDDDVLSLDARPPAWFRGSAVIELAEPAAAVRPAAIVAAVEELPVERVPTTAWLPMEDAWLGVSSAGNPTPPAPAPRPGGFAAPSVPPVLGLPDPTARRDDRF